MSERTINENNKLWAAAEKIAEEAVAAKKAASEEERREVPERGERTHLGEGLP